MRVLVDLGSHVAGSPAITQVEKVPPTGEGTPINGKYLLPIYPTGEFEITDSDYVLNPAGDCDGGDLSSKSFAYLLMQYPMYGYVYFNPLLTADHVGELDLTATFGALPTRAMTGRALGPQAGQMPTHTCILPQNNTSVPPHPGILITQDIDISAYTSGVGTEEFLVYWKLYDFSVGADVTDEYTDTNEPAVRQVYETDDEPSGFSVYISPDNGMTWSEVGYLTPLVLAAKTTTFRLAFENTSANRVYLANFAVLF